MAEKDAEAHEKHGVVFKIPIQCKCGKIDPCHNRGPIPIIMRWCASCGTAICPDCFPKEKQEGLERCQQCLDENRPTRMEIYGRTLAFRREQAILKWWGEDIYAKYNR